MKKIKILCLSLMFFFMSGVFVSGFLAAETENYDTLLQNYLSNDRSLKEAELQYEQALLSYQKSLIQNAIAISLSSGNSQVFFDKDETKLSFSPSVNLSIPEFQNTKIEAKAPISFPLEKDAPVSINDAGLSLSLDLVSSMKKNRDLSLKRAKESLEDATKKRDAKVLSLQKEFLQSFKSIYSSQTNLLTQEENALSKETDLVMLKAQGYEEESARYRLAYLSWQSVLRDYEVAKRNFEKDAADFATKCGVESFNFEITIPVEELLSFEDFPKTDFANIKASLLNYENNSLAQNAKTPFTLSFNAGYGFSSIERNAVRENTSNLSSGLSFKKDGFSANLGMQNNLDALENPRINFSLGYSFSEQKLSKISKEEDILQEKILAHSIENALILYESTLNDKEKQKDDLIWQLSKNKDQEALYADLADDMREWYEKGIISQSEYKQALANYTKASTQVRMSEIDYLIYNIDLALLFN